MAAMTTMLLVATALSALNVVLLALLAFVWFRNYRTFRTSLVLGLVAFALVLLVENLTAIYFFLSMQMLYSATPTVHTAVAVLEVLEFLALVILTYVTLK